MKLFLFFKQTNFKYPTSIHRQLCYFVGFKLLLDVFCVSPSTVSSSIELLQQGHLLAIAPGPYVFDIKYLLKK